MASTVSQQHSAVTSIEQTDQSEDSIGRAEQPISGVCPSRSVACRCKQSTADPLDVQASRIPERRMKVKQFLAWNKRLAAVYAVGVWTMVGGYALYYYTTGRYLVPASPPPALEPEFIEDTSLEDQPKKKRIKHTIVYKENFVPYSTRVHNLWNSVFGTTSETTRNMDKVEK